MSDVIIGGTEAIGYAERIARLYRLKEAATSIDVALLENQLRLLIDRIMSEGGMYAPEYAALALKQAEGDPFEAAFLIRAYGSTLPRNHYSYALSTDNMRLIRRISSTFRDIPGGQVLGPTYDYTHHMLNFQLLHESDEEIEAFLKEALQDRPTENDSSAAAFPKVIELLRREELLPAADPHPTDREPFDITRQKMKLPSPRSARLQLLARGETGAMVTLAYSALRGYGHSHPTIGELRVGYTAVCIPHPYESGEDEDGVYLGEMLLTEVETINAMSVHEATGRVRFQLGYGLCFGQNEAKALAMAILESELRAGGTAPVQDEEFVLMHIDSIDASGFVSHLKLPHYVTFQSKLDVLREGVKNGKRADERLEHENEKQAISD